MLRLVEHSPSWEIHALLRIFDVSYRVDYSPLPTALGRTLPIVVDDEGICQGQDILDCVKRHRRRDTFSHEDDMDELVGSAIRQRFEHLWSSLSQLSGHQRDQAVRASPFGLNFYIGHRFDLQSLFSMNRSAPIDAEKYVEIVEDRLFHEYFQIDRILQDYPSSSIIFSWPVMRDQFSYSRDQREMRHLADALLFGYIAKALIYPSLMSRISQLDHLIKFFVDIATGYFQNHDSTDETGTWKVSLYRLLQNPYVVQNPDYKKILEFITCEEIEEYGLMSYPLSSSEQIADDPSEFVLPKVANFESWREVNQLPTETTTISIGGVVLTTIVTACFATFIMKARFQ